MSLPRFRSHQQLEPQPWSRRRSPRMATVPLRVHRRHGVGTTAPTRLQLHPCCPILRLAWRRGATAMLGQWTCYMKAVVVTVAVWQVIPLKLEVHGAQLIPSLAPQLSLAVVSSHHLLPGKTLCSGAPADAARLTQAPTAQGADQPGAHGSSCCAGPPNQLSDASID